MKKIITLATITVAAFVLTACGGSQPKEAPATTAAETKAVDPIVGNWSLVKMVVTDGKEAIEEDAPTESYCKFEEDGTIIMTDNGEAKSGTWKEAAPATYLIMISDNEMTFNIDGDTLVYQFESPISKGTYSQFIFERK